MKRILSLLLVFTMLLSFCAFAAFAEEEAVIDIEVLEVGFCPETVMGYMRNVEKFTQGSSAIENTSYGLMYLNAREGTTFFVVKANISNISDRTLRFDNDLKGSAIFIGKESCELNTYAYQEYSSPAYSELLPGESSPAVLVCQVTEDYAEDFEGCTLNAGGLSLSYGRENLVTKEQIVFERPRGSMLVDGVEVSDEEAARILEAEKAAAKEQPQAAPAEVEKHVDELSVEDVSFESKSGLDETNYILSIKVRNNAFPTFDDRELINVVVNFRLLDAAGDGLPSESSIIESFSDLPALAPGESGWAKSPYNLSKDSVDNAEYIMFSSYELRYSADANGQWKQIKGSFSENPKFKISDLIPQGKEAFLLENVSVEFTDDLPPDVTGSSEYQSGTMEFDYSLEDSETYAVINFSITNLTKQEIILSDKRDTVIELNFDDGFIYSTGSDNKSPHIFHVGNEISILHTQERTSLSSTTTRIGNGVSIPPLVTYDVTLYLPCSELVGRLTDRSLVLTVKTSQTGYTQSDVQIR